MVHTTGGSIQSRKDYKKTPSGQYKYWEIELKASQKNLKDFHKEGTKIDLRYKGGKRKTQEGGGGKKATVFRLNLFHSNVITLQSMLYGRLPTIDVSRRYNDPNDDVGRVAAEIMERVLNNDVAENPETYRSVLKATLQDRLLPGLGVARVRYDYNEETKEEDAPLDYYHWRDVCWGWSRTFDEIPWIAFRSYLNKDEIETKFGEKAAEGVQLERQSTAPDTDEASSTDDDGPWQKAAVWEIWDKIDKKICWLSLGWPKILDSKKDFLKIPGFYPCPPFMLANQTTTLYSPTSDYYLAQDLYNEIDTLQTRISIITEAVKVVGVYNQAASEISRMFKEGTDNDLIPVDNWALFAEGGGIKGQIDWVPMKEIVETLNQLRELRDEQIGLLQQVTGMSDIMRGELSGQYEGVGQSKMKVEFGSVRVQALQEEFATFASNLMKIKACIIGNHYEPDNIARLANTESFMDADKALIPQAIELIKDPAKSKLRILIRPESVAMIDYQKLQGERGDFLNAISTFFQAAAPIIEMEPTTAPFMLQMLQWSLAGYKGSSEIEGVIDKAIQVSQEEAKSKQDKPDPDKAKAESAIALEKLKHQNNMTEITAKAEADNMERDKELDSKIKVIVAELKADIQTIISKMVADIKTEQQTSQINAEQGAIGVEGEMKKDTHSAALEMTKDAAAAALDIEVENNKPKPDTGDSDA